jgi:hypothetical protein
MVTSVGDWHEEERAAAHGDETRHAARLAGGARGVGDLALQHLVVVLLHHVLGPLLQVRIAQISDPEGGLRALPVGRVFVALVLRHGAGEPGTGSSSPPPMPAQAIPLEEKSGGCARPLRSGHEARDRARRKPLCWFHNSSPGLAGRFDYITATAHKT